ncbi:hypothetical protein COCSUDRAFT_68209 [Coccomyxa subellipsoidea C-169]|uniref:Fungal lipase-type domain-containing protein n=1 Tax=Coccomyxa subellipsoidea (strain C-169) TaxID=574566 RepID=I0YJ73_COCSC|nr:hypothetical protein COCSUDRAFT_68209 [Coccomyxa subellipsoidea C-169]EIE18442.1 hypothetical protein COCSUDRAFT_68209 [Coccomyxa subellipsoidea C-169]|eukprot:XP_005642986.1 hypothetical protein COCSUDRAFT_68209 [Coccomyxa subellipsoidea C-169]
MPSWPEHEPQQVASQRAAAADDSFQSLMPVSEGITSPPIGHSAVMEEDRSGRVRRLNADVNDALLHGKGQGFEGGDTAYREGVWDVEKGGECDGASSAASEDEEVDFMGGFSVNSNFDPNVDVVLRFEFESARQLRVTAAFVLLSLLVGITAFIILLIISRSIVDDSFLFRSTALEYMNLIAAAIIIGLTVTVVTHFTYRRIVTTAADHLIQEVTWLAPNAWTLSHDCAWFGKFVAICGIIRWSTLNLMMIIFVITGHNTNPWADKKGKLLGGRADAIVLDAPQWRTHSPKLILWAIFEIPYVLELTDIFSPFYAEKRYITLSNEGDCRSWRYSCSPPNFTKIATFSGGVMMTVYLLLYVYYLHRGFVLLRSRPYNSFRVGNVLVRLQASRTITAFAVAILTCVFLWFINPTSCASFFFSWQGLFPMQVVVAALVIADCVSFMPGNPHNGDDPILQVWLQQFAWTEAQKTERLAERLTRLTGPAAAEALAAEPMFCFETALKALYWSTLVYRYDETAPDLTRDKPALGDGPSQPRFTPQAGMGMFGLQQVQLFWERSLDTKVLIGWSERTIVISFRGTASLRNAIADLQAWRVAHPPRRGRWWLASLPMVHSGFHYSWTANGLNRRVIAHVHEIIAASGLKAANIRVLLTGHSLGGALAGLAAHDLVTQCGLTNCQVYTFGAPRPGNRAFKQEYDQLVPDTWHIINDADAVPRVGKFLVLFARPGQRVIVDYRGDVVVRPSPHEIHIRNGSNPGHHFLASYRRALMGICQAQFTGKALKGGHDAVLHLAHQPELRVFLAACGLPPETLQRLSAAAALRRSETARARLLRRMDSSAPVPQRLQGEASYHGYGAKLSVMFDRVGSRHMPPLSWRRQSASVSGALTSLGQGPRISEEEAEMAASMHESDTGATEAVQASAGTPLESVLSIPPPATGEPPETPRQGEMFVRGAVELGSPSAATSAQGELRNELLDKGLAPFQGTPSRSSPSMRSLASSPMHWLGRRRSMAASPGRAPALGVRRSIDPQPSAQPPHVPLRRAVTEAPQQLSLAVAEAGRWEPPPLPDWRSAWQELVPEKSDADAEIVYRAEYRPTAAEMPASPFVSPREQEPERKPAASAAAAAGGRRPPRPSSTTASPTPSAPATPRRAAAPMTVPSSSPPSDARRWPAGAPVSASPPRPAMLPRHSTGAVRLAAAAHLEELPRRHSAAYVSSPAALPPLAVRTSVILGDAPPPSSVPSTPAASRRPPLLRQRTVGSWLMGAVSDLSAGESAAESSQPSLLQRATQSLGGRASWRQQEIQAVLQKLQNEPDMVEGSLGSASRGPGGPAERRERATISARIENAVVPELGALAARCSRLVGQASLAFKIRTDPDEEMTDMQQALQELEDAKLDQDAPWSISQKDSMAQP